MPELSRNERRNLRLQRMLIELERHPDGLSWADLWPLLAAAVPEVDEDREKTSTGSPKGQTDVRWQAANLDKSGWVLTGGDRLRVTSQGREALRRYENPAELYAAATRGYAEWQKLRDDARAEPLDGLVQDGLLPTEPGEPALRRAAARILSEGLRDGRSAFSATHAAWSRESVAELHAAFIGQPDTSGDTFDVKLQRQLAGCSDDAILLTAEILALQMLPLSDFKLDTKRGRIKRVLGFMREPVAMPADVNAAMDTCVFNGSLTFKTLIWRTLGTAIEVASAWWRLDDAARERAWSDPWAWRDLVESAQGDTIASARAELRYLAHPEAFPAIISIQHQRMIREAFAGEVGVAPTADLDRDLYDITMALQRRSGAPVDYYVGDLHASWANKPSDPDNPSPVRPSRRAWLVRGSSVKGIDVTHLWSDEGFVSLAASQLSPISLPADSAEITQAVTEGYAHLSYAKREEKLRDVTSFLQRMEPGDLVLTTSSGSVRLGELTGPATYLESEQGLSNLRRPASWPAESVVDFADLPPELAGRLKSGSDVTDLTDVLPLVEGLMAEMGRASVDPVVDVPTPVRLLPLSAETADRLLIGRAWLDEFVELLGEQHQVILYGPPGTGKTFLAQKVAEALAPPENVKLVQFHPAYSYEDFFEGYRPVQLDEGQVGFKLKAGPFRRIVEDAVEHPQQPFILIVDEINRANLAKVFGELYFLLEYRDAAIDLLYSDDTSKQFQLPKNVFIIGTMNTADRSIALVDAAMRRRFAFLSLHPDDEHMRGVLPAWLERQELPVNAAELLAVLNERIPDRELAVGPSYLMNPGVGSDEGLQRIWRTQILPLLGEYHVGEDLDVEQRYGLAALRGVLQSRKLPDDVVDDDDAAMS